MQRTNRARWIAVFVVLFAGPIMAVAVPEDGKDAPQYFSMNGPGQNGGTLNAPQTAPGQTPGLAPGASATNAAPPKRFSAFRFYLKSTYGPTAIMASMAGSGIRQAWDWVPEWGQGMEGYGKRFASSFAQKAVKRSIHMTVGSLLKEDPRYVPSGRSGIWKRTLYAIGRTFVSQKYSGGTRPAYSRFAGAVGGAIISQQWNPKSHRTALNCFAASSISLSLDVAGNVFSEFWPSLKKLLPR